jgi:glycine/D-amino acid oxidase-like deaminating enzyme
LIYQLPNIVECYQENGVNVLSHGKTTMKNTENTYDVIVAGAGPTGLTAAIQAARAGARCLLVEKSGLLGGATVTGGVNFPGLFHAWGQQIIAGIGWELVVKAVEEAGESLPDFSEDGRRHWQRQVLVNRFTYAAVADSMVQEAGVQLLLHTMPASIEKQDDGWKVDLAGKEGLFSVQASVLIDATGDGNLVSLAGGPIRRNATLQPGTLIFRAEGYANENLNHDEIVMATQTAIDRGEILATDVGGAAGRVRTLLFNHGENLIHITDIDARTSQGKTDAELKGRAALLRVQRFLRKQPGLENFHVTYFAPECGIRETVTIDGEVEVTCQDYASGRLWEDAVCYSFYPIDIHVDHGIDTRPLQHGALPTMPLRSMLPKGTQNLLAAGRIACGDKEANSAFRVQGSCMAMGQAVGALAAIAAQTSKEVREVPISQVKDLLESHGAIFPSAR